MKHTSEENRRGLSYNSQAILKGTWALCLFFTAVYILVAIITADDNEKSDGGYRVVGFCGIWTSFMMTAIMSLSAQVVFDEWHSPFVVGSLIGACGMLAQMQFVLMIVYFVFADHSRDNGHDVTDSDRALGAFSLFTMLSFALLGAVLAAFQGDITGSNRERIEEEDRMMDRSGSTRGSLDKGIQQEELEETGVVDVDLEMDDEEMETF